MSERVTKHSPHLSRSFGPIVQGLGTTARGVQSDNAVFEAKLSSQENGLRDVANEAPVSEFVVVVVETSWNGYAAPAVWQIQMWHVTMLRSSKNPIPQATPQKVI